MKIPVTIANWMTIGTSPPYIEDQAVPPPTSRTATMTMSVIATLTVRTLRYVGKSSGPMSWRPKLTERVSPR